MAKKIEKEVVFRKKISGKFLFWSTLYDHNNHNSCCWILSLLNCVMGMLACSRALRVTCSSACMLGTLKCLAYLCSRVFRVPTSLRVQVFNMLACFMSLRVRMSQILAVLKYLTCLHACVLLWHCLPDFLYM